MTRAGHVGHPVHPAAPPDIAATNQTLNAFLGGSRRSWMAVAGRAQPAEPVRSPPLTSPLISRRRRRAAGQTQPAGSPLEPGERFPSSNSTSPQLANVVRPKSISIPAATPDADALPSPTPSDDCLLGGERGRLNDELVEEQDVCAPAGGAHDGRVQSEASDKPSSNELEYATASEEASVGSQATHLPARTTLASKRRKLHVDSTVNEASNQASSPNTFHRPQTIPSPQRRCSPSPTSSLAPTFAAAPTGASPQAQSHEQPSLPLSPRLQQHPPQLTDQAAVNSPAQSAVESPSEGEVSRHNPQEGSGHLVGRSGSLTLPQASTPASLPSHDVLSQQRQTSHQYSPYSPAYCDNLLKVFHNRFGDPPNLAHSEQLRFHLLRLAADQGDHFYLILHQFFCLACFPRALPQELANAAGLTRTIEVLGDLLAKNESLDRWFVNWCARFPTEISNARMWCPDHVRVLIRFMALTQERWDPFISAYKQLGWPPMPHAIENSLCVPSPVLQEVVFTFLLRQIWGMVNSTWVSQAIRLFRRWRQACAHNARSPTQQDIDLYASTMKQYLHNHQNLIQKRYPTATAGAPAPYQPQLQAHPMGMAQTQSAALTGMHGVQLGTVASHSPGQMVLPSQHFSRPLPAVSYGRRQMHPAALAGAGSLSGAAGHMTAGNNAAAFIHPHLMLASQHARPRQSLVPLVNQQLGAYRPAQLSVPPRPLIPPLGYITPQPAAPDPTRTALHQAHLRSPTLKCHSSDSILPETPAVLYRYVNGFALPPQRLDLSNALLSWAFDISDSDFEKIPRDQRPKVIGSLPQREVNEKSQLYRLKCVKIFSPGAIPPENEWVVADNTWPSTVFYRLNGKDLEPRRKLHNGRDLPIDLTSHIKLGQNKLEVFIIRRDSEQSPLEYALAVEIVNFKSRQDIAQDCLGSQRLSAVRVLESMVKGLSPGADDDEITIVSSNLTITLFEPFSASKIFDLPVRGLNCRHYDCFDLEIFLQTRKRKDQGSPSEVDDWRCPLCKLDVRPQSLAVDGFLVKVREKLAETGQLHTRAITVHQDGSWSPKFEKSNAVTEPAKETKNSRLVSGPSEPSTTPLTHSEFIELDDD